MEKGVESFLHRHPLKLYRRDEVEVNDDERFVCQGCRKTISNFYYGCRICNFSLHELCMKIHQERRGLIHPCTLYLEIAPRYSCRVCHQSREGFVYRCERCRFNVDLECCELEKEKTEMNISHFSHPHPLALLVPIMKAFSPKSFSMSLSQRTYCNFCGHEVEAYQVDYNIPENFKVYVYGCDKCNFYLHRGCKNYLFQRIQHDSHSCPLFLHPHDTRYRCNQCNEECDISLAFRCNAHNYNLCGACYMMPITGKTIKYENAILTERVINNELVGMFPCSLCGELCCGPTYFESRQGYLHERCAQLWFSTNDINHYYHPEHPLSKRQEGIACNLCMGSRRFLAAFWCMPCKYELHLKCTLLTNSVHYDSHEHLLTMVSKITSHSWDMNAYANNPPKCLCQRCKGFCFQSSHLFQCGACTFALHLLCGPLPCTIKHVSHVHSLTLTEFLVDEEVDNACCHVCEGHRDPKLAVYYCQECRFIAEIECVISEVLATYRGERGKVKLRTLGARIPCRLVIDKDLDSSEEQVKRGRPTSIPLFQDILSSMKQDEKDQWDSVIQCIGEEIDKSPDFLKEGYTSIMVRRLQDRDPLEFMFFDELKDEEIFKLRECWVPRSFFLAFENLLNHFGDFTATSKMNPIVKSLCLLVLLEFLRSVKDTTTQVVQVTEESYQKQWDFFNKFVQYAGFDTFLLKDLREGIDWSHSLLQIEKDIDEASISFGREIESISARIKHLEAKREAAREEFRTFVTRRLLGLGSIGTKLKKANPSIFALAQVSNWDPRPIWELPSGEPSDSR